MSEKDRAVFVEIGIEEAEDMLAQAARMTSAALNTVRDAVRVFDLHNHEHREQARRALERVALTSREVSRNAAALRLLSIEKLDAGETTIGLAVDRLGINKGG